MPNYLTVIDLAKRPGTSKLEVVALEGSSCAEIIAIFCLWDGAFIQRIK